jgi:hypothetical protein
MRYRRYVFDIDILSSLFSEGQHLIEKYSVSGGLPSDAKLINAKHGWPNSVELLIESGEFPLVEKGNEIPLFPITVTTER